MHLTKGKSMRVGLMLRNIEEKGGIAVYTRLIAENLLAQDLDNEYYLFAGRPESLEAFAEAPNAHPIILPCRQKFFWDQVQVARAVNRLGLDIDASGPRCQFHCAAARAKSSRYTALTNTFFPKEFSIVDRYYVRMFMPLFGKTADCILTPSETARDELAEILGVPVGKFVVTPEGAKDIFRQPIAEERLRAVRRKYDLEGEFILHVGLIWGSKNFGVLPEVLEIINRQRPLVLVHAGKPQRWGDGEGTTTSRFLKRLGFVPDEDLASLYQSAMALVFPSLYEGFGIPIVEAFASGCPVVTANWGTMKEVGGDAALLVDVRKPEEIAAAVLRLSAEPGLRQELQSRGFERAKRFTWQETARLTLEAFRSVADGSFQSAWPTDGARIGSPRTGTGG